MVACTTVCLPASSQAQEPTIPPEVTLDPSSVTNGHVIFVKITTRLEAAAIQLLFGDRYIPLSETPVRDKGHYFALVGIPYYSKQGQAQLTLKWSGTAGLAEQSVPFQIVSGKYRSERLKVNAGKVSPSKADLQRIRKDREAVKAVYAGGHFNRLWTKPFEKPIKSTITSPFGSKRLFNGKTKSYHSGLDFRAAVGTPIYAANAGIVKLAQDLFFSGNIVIIDHGMGVFTNYAHLSRMDVSPEQYVERGQQIGLAGATGRVNGPHLHWGAKVSGVTVNPMELIERLAPLYTQPRTRTAKKTSTGPTANP